MAGVVVVFDFDMTIIDCDSDEWIVGEFGAAELFDQLRPTMPWNPLMDRMMMELHAKGTSVEEIAGSLKRIPMDSHITNAIQTAYAMGCDLRVVSDANVIFIETVLEHHGLLGCFSEINTNPCCVDDESGRLCIRPYHDSQAPPHGCSLCPPNMCKGMIMERIRATTNEAGAKRFIYIGDGRGDYCPSLKLRKGDAVMPRKEYPLWKLIHGNMALLDTEIREWSNGEELEQGLLRVIERPLSVDHPAAPTELLAVDCKLHTIPVGAHEAFPQALPVPY